MKEIVQLSKQEYLELKNIANLNNEFHKRV